MAKTMNQKGKILYLEKILKETTEDHPCSMQEILERLTEYGISAERKSIYDDMEVLRSVGMNIRFKRGKAAGYYVAEEPEKSLDDSVSGTEPEEKVSEKKERFEYQTEEKALKLVCKNACRNEILKAFGSNVQFKENDGDLFVAVVPVKETAEFYGWLASMGRDVVIGKPKKAAQGYKDYLKGILKEYK